EPEMWRTPSGFFSWFVSWMLILLAMPFTSTMRLSAGTDVLERLAAALSGKVTCRAMSRGLGMRDGETGSTVTVAEARRGRRAESRAEEVRRIVEVGVLGGRC